MSITASRFGSSPVLLDWSGITSTVKAQTLEMSAEKRAEYSAQWQGLVSKLTIKFQDFIMP